MGLHDSSGLLDAGCWGRRNWPHLWCLVEVGKIAQPNAIPRWVKYPQIPIAPPALEAGGIQSAQHRKERTPGHWYHSQRSSDPSEA